jgi:ferredoxin
MSGALSRRGLLMALTPGTPAHKTSTSDVAVRTSVECLEEKAVGCRRCAEVCDVEAISFAPMGAGRARLVISDERCNGCGACRNVCPVAAIGLAPRDRMALAAGLASLVRDNSGASA